MRFNRALWLVSAGINSVSVTLFIFLGGMPWMGMTNFVLAMLCLAAFFTTEDFNRR